ncbi:MAG: DUF402 domain-containing protein [Clostridia bacterium]|nr:DUF402 domain-containing protein [Clostridia bacterium]
MGELIRTLDRTPQKRVVDRDFAFCECGEIGGYASLTHFIKLTAPGYCTYCDGVRVTIVDDGCYWLQFAPKGENYWITALLWPDGTFDHAYFDMTEYNVVDGAKSYFRDMYLDVTIKKRGEVFVLDEDELSAALSRGDITRENYDTAHKTCDRIVKRYGGENVRDLIAFCQKYFDILLPELTERRVVKMNLCRAPFDKIKSGEKNVELRLYDEKRRALNVGDVIEFSCEGETFSVKVVDLCRADSFKTLFETFSTAGMGFDDGETLDDCVLSMRKYYGEDEEKQCGVLGIRIKPL